MSRPPKFKYLQATSSLGLTATLGTPRPLLYEHGAHPLEDLPGHVRAASAIRRHGHRLVILQDDVSALAVLDPATGSTSPILLPAGQNGERVFEDRRGNKKRKLDLEACVVLPDGRLVAFGSGSNGHREKLVTLAAGAGAMAQQLSGEHLYAELRLHSDTRGAQMNIEGAVVQGDWLRLLQRGNGKRGLAPWNAILDLPLDGFLGWLDGRHPVPAVRRILEIHLGEVAGVPFGFTDAAVTGDGRIAVLACAEDTNDAVNDGPVLACRFGWLDAEDRSVVMTDVVQSDGRPTHLKLEGIEARLDGGPAFDVVADMDRGDEPAQLAELTVRG